MITPAGTPKHYRGVAFERVTGATRLFRDFLGGAAGIRPFFGPAGDDAKAVTALADELGARAYPRAALHTALADLAVEVGASGPALTSIERFRHDDTLVVFAGQQTGLFTGPLYTVYKALTVERWARELSARCGRRVVPMFWLPADDHDFAEVEWVECPRGAALETIRYRPVPARSGEPVGRITIDAGIEEVTAQYAAALPDSEFKSDVFAALRRAYAPGRRYVAAMARLWYELFPQSELVFVSPDHPSVARAAAPLFQKALQDEGELYRLYRAASDLLLSRGYHAQVHKSPDQTFLLHQQFQRHSIHRQGDTFLWEGSEPVTGDHLLERIVSHPDCFSANVLLRPVVQNALFPVLGVVLGPSEIAYYAQIGGLHDHFGVPRPLVLPRTSVTIVEATVARRLQRHGVDLVALRADLDLEVARALRARFPHDLHETLARAAGRIEAVFDEVRPAITSFEPTLEAPARAAGVRARREMEQLTQRAYAAHKRREEETESQIRRAALQVFPGGELQERRFNIVYYWARYGPAWLARLYEEWPTGERDHLLWEG
jgi:bacillithiol biosynthesis cysteine-adding enzyme BshC